MSREIKFRAWVLKDEKMIQHRNRAPAVKMFAPDYAYTNKEVIVMQYTGLKDKNGTEIYEGDILYVEQIEVIDPYIPHKKNVAVKYDERNTAFEFDEENGFVIGLYTIPRELEVIGNIYENQELLEERDVR